MDRHGHLGEGDKVVDIRLQDAAGQHDAVMADLLDDPESLRGTARTEVDQLVPDLPVASWCHDKPPRRPTRSGNSQLQLRLIGGGVTAQQYTRYTICSALHHNDKIRDKSVPSLVRFVTADDPVAEVDASPLRFPLILKNTGRW
jgi:hypothetical protein